MLKNGSSTPSNQKHNHILDCQTFKGKRVVYKIRLIESTTSKKCINNLPCSFSFACTRFAGAADWTFHIDMFSLSHANALDWIATNISKWWYDKFIKLPLPWCYLTQGWCILYGINTIHACMCEREESQDFIHCRLAVPSRLLICLRLLRIGRKVVVLFFFVLLLSW